MKVKVEKSLQSLVQKEILRIIRDRRLGPGSQIPTESELIKLIGIGRSTLREALSNLVYQGLLYKVQGKGTFIRQLPVVVKNGIDNLFSVTEAIKAVGYTPSTSRLTMETKEPDPRIAELLDIEETDQCYYLERLRRADDMIAAYCIEVLPVQVFPSDITANDFKGSIFTILNNSGHIMSHTESTLSPVVLTPRDIPELTNPLSLFLLFEEVYYNTQGKPVCYSNDYYSADVFDFRMIRKRQL
ncbi:transcriptional regulator, GntR family [Denitrovibrio acetiphilus DSM 12809]|uniref:Transcriptional regulator, GntR family n=1 Tax=Denitrovibrio acetiphilus (strain DSM 12809 / NBRC 114555 / N2460) TaxID=522772 RepID=D4H277_DENA2|nr:GntR family transcriptional regulator [Denitrovibrio acetiphilus]ADD68868.1 transcriptional regulator, GntR family [Denitrovibrio acetiphilus DSM 12809]